MAKYEFHEHRCPECGASLIVVAEVASTETPNIRQVSFTSVKCRSGHHLKEFPSARDFFRRVLPGAKRYKRVNGGFEFQ